MSSTFAHQLVLHSIDDCNLFIDEVIAKIESLGFPEMNVFAIRLCMDEALTNAVKHGNKLDESKKVNVRYSLDNEVFQISIEDEGDGFDPDNLPDPRDVDNLEKPCGRGVMLMRSYMTSVSFNEKGNCVDFTKRADCPLPTFEDEEEDEDLYSDEEM